MKIPSLHLAVDLGASGGRVLSGQIVDDRLVMEAVARFGNEPVMLQDQLCWDVVGLWRDICGGLKTASDADAIASVGVATWGVDYVLLDADDHIVGPAIHYRDARTRGAVPQALKRVPRADFFAETGIQFMEINSAIQLFADARDQAIRLKIAETFLMIPDFFHWLLSGEKYCELTNASTTQLYNPKTHDWSDKVIEGLGIPRKIFGAIAPPGMCLGPVQPSVGEITGLHDVPVIIPATHDTGSAVLAVPAEGFAPAKPNWCYISSGTWSLIGCELPEPKINDKCSRYNFTNEGGVGGSTRLLKNIGGLWIFQQIRASLQNQGKTIDWNEMVRQAKEAPALSFLLDPDDPAFVSPVDMVQAIRQSATRTGQAQPDSDAVLFRAALEGLALRYRQSVSILEDLTGSTIDTIHVVGGGSQNPLLCQMTADACGRRVIAGPAEATGIGNLLMQMIGLGILSEVAEARQLVRRSFRPVTYQPKDSKPYDDVVDRFHQLTSSHL